MHLWRAWIATADCCSNSKRTGRSKCCGVQAQVECMRVMPRGQRYTVSDVESVLKAK